MPKMKSHRGAAKRFKRTGTGKIVGAARRHGIEIDKSSNVARPARSRRRSS